MSLYKLNKEKEHGIEEIMTPITGKIKRVKYEYFYESGIKIKACDDVRFYFELEENPGEVFLITPFPWSWRINTGERIKAFHKPPRQSYLEIISQNGSIQTAFETFNIYPNRDIASNPFT